MTRVKRDDGRARAADHERKGRRQTDDDDNRLANTRTTRDDEGAIGVLYPAAARRADGDRQAPRRAESSRANCTITTRTLGRHRRTPAEAGASIRAPSTTRAVIGRGGAHAHAIKRARSELRLANERRSGVARVVDRYCRATMAGRLEKTNDG